MSVLTEKDPRDVVYAPVVSEKSYANIDEGKYTFLVATSATKSEIKYAVEKIFGVKVEKVNTVNRPGKRKRTRFGWGSRNATKRAIITLKEGYAIDIFGGSAA
ncbi:50S ribosomal protein L23 [Nesterenkonia flava]|uniref:Large ribosomal subunit protein uL23 n=1 Tax=Nesterenkonia flava TaxID=469799 RepID=A0ABU1FUU1_9MICC|nr:50S ribosomal protein L23 [Nesterenkonia flava]MDR5712437.1 50S ribosomal protein L23 [Nesterenkonia flava]